MAAAEEEFDLYGEVTAAPAEGSASIAELEERAEAAEAKFKALATGTGKLKKRAELLKRQNDLLKRNISILYNTAKTEMCPPAPPAPRAAAERRRSARKDATIAELRRGAGGGRAGKRAHGAA